MWLVEHTAYKIWWYVITHSSRGVGVYFPLPSPVPQHPRCWHWVNNVGSGPMPSIWHQTVSHITDTKWGESSVTGELPPSSNEGVLCSFLAPLAFKDSGLLSSPERSGEWQGSQEPLAQLRPQFVSDHFQMWQGHSFLHDLRRVRLSRFCLIKCTHNGPVIL